jgi:hypothetical protein
MIFNILHSRLAQHYDTAVFFHYLRIFISPSISDMAIATHSQREKERKVVIYIPNWQCRMTSGMSLDVNRF